MICATKGAIDKGASWATWMGRKPWCGDNGYWKVYWIESWIAPTWRAAAGPKIMLVTCQISFKDTIIHRHSPNIRPSSSLSTMTTELFVKEGVEIRRLKSGQCVQEDERTQFFYVNEMRSPRRRQWSRLSNIGSGLGFILHAQKRTI